MSSSTLETFAPFPRLPLELRNQIWELALPSPRLIFVQTERGEIFLPGRVANRKFSHVWSTKRVPVPFILHVCCDSRAIGLQNYELAFDSNCRPAKEDLPDLHELPASRTRPSALEFPFDKKAMVYVDLERDVIVTSHRRLGHRAPPGGWPKEESEEPRFKAWRVVNDEFKIETFREVISKEVYMRIRTFAAKFVFTMREIFFVPFGRGTASRRRVLVVRDPFLPAANGEDFIDGIKGMPLMKIGPCFKGKVRSLRNVVEVQTLLEDGTLWDWVVDRETDERAARYAAGIVSEDEDEDEEVEQGGMNELTVGLT